MKKKRNYVEMITSKWTVFAVQLIVSMILLGLIFKLNVLPTKFFMILVAVIALLLLLLMCYALMSVSKKRKKKKQPTGRIIFGKVLSLLLSICLAFGSIYLAKTNSTLDAIGGANTQTHTYALYVKADSSVEEVSQLTNPKVGVNLMTDTDNMNTAISELKGEVAGVSTTEFNDFNELAEGLYSGKVKAILVNQAYLALLEEEHEKFQSETKVIWTFDIDEELQDIAKEVNVTNSPFVVFLSGIDTVGKVSTVSRSDVNMLVTINPNTRQILMTSIPRDYYVTLPNKGKKDKLTHAGLAGIENSVKALEGLLDIDVNYYGKVNFTSVTKIVNALGGVTVNSPYSFTTFDGVRITKGENYLNGSKALSFVRERHNLPNGDNDRVHNQQLLLQGMIEKAISPSILANYNGVLNAISGAFETNMATSDITSLIKMQLNEGGGWEILQTQLTGTGKTMTGGAYMPGSKLYYMIPNEQSVKENSDLIKKVMNNEKIALN